MEQFKEMMYALNSNLSVKVHSSYDTNVLKQLPAIILTEENNSEYKLNLNNQSSCDYYRFKVDIFYNTITELEGFLEIINTQFKSKDYRKIQAFMTNESDGVKHYIIRYEKYK